MISRSLYSMFKELKDLYVYNASFLVFLIDIWLYRYLSYPQFYNLEHKDSVLCVLESL